jgi:hypothetical protein
MEIDQVLIREILAESLSHAIAMAPALFVVFVLMEVVSHGTRPIFISSALKHSVAGPVAAAGLGLLPQCGFSVAATMLYVEGMVPAGSLLASFIATSDEAVPILVANPATLPWVMPLLAVKLAWGIAVGVGVNAAARAFRGASAGKRSVRPIPPHEHADIHTHAGNCVGEKARVRDYLPHALSRTLRTIAMVFVLSVALDLAGKLAQNHLPGALSLTSSWQPLAASFLGLIPSCATSVALAEGFRAGLVSFPALLSGLTANSGMGLLVLLKESRDSARTMLIVGLLVI